MRWGDKQRAGGWALIIHFYGSRLVTVNPNASPYFRGFHMDLWGQQELVSVVGKRVPSRRHQHYLLPHLAKPSHQIFKVGRTVVEGG